MVVIKNKNEFDTFVSHIHNKNVFIDVYQKNLHKHPVNDEVLCLFVKIHDDPTTYIINFLHNDCCKIDINLKITEVVDRIVKSSKHIFVTNKKRFIQLCKQTKVEDLLIYEFDQGLVAADEGIFESNYEKINKRRLYNVSDYYLTIPIVKLKQSFELKCQYYFKYIKNFEIYESYEGLNGIITETLSEIESNGLHVNSLEFDAYFSDKRQFVTNNFVYTEYNTMTSTGRPSNRFNGINYAALPKETGCRRSFDSRFGNDGMLIAMDYSAYHPRIIANLINFPIHINVNIYDYLGRQYFNLNRECNTEEIAKSKQLTFVNLYGGIKEEYIHIPYFMKTFEYIEQRWNFFKENGYVETPIFKRRILLNHIMDATPNKMFNYILQAAETEFSIKNINVVNQYLKNKLTKVILYTYDSILLDAHKTDGIETLQEIKQIMTDNQFPVKCYAGKNYNDMTLIKI